MKKKPIHPIPPNTVSQPDADAIRDYAYHLYIQSGCVPGRDEDNWFEAKACLQANIPKHLTHARLHHHISRPADCRSTEDAAAIACAALDAKNLVT